jgi:uncharacterized protein
MAEFLYMVRPPRATFADDATEKERAVIAAHFAYLQGMRERGELILAGRCENAEFGIVVFEAADEAAARRVMQDDPAVSAGVFSAKLYPFGVALERGR